VISVYLPQGYLDELAWAAAWLYKATNTTSYLTDAKVSPFVFVASHIGRTSQHLFRSMVADVEGKGMVRHFCWEVCLRIETNAVL